MLLLVLLAVLAIIAFGVGFTIHWLFIVAAVLALIWLITLFTGGLGTRSGRRL
ncbi:MAG: hydrophobic protein [Gaiellaceae bacterium]